MQSAHSARWLCADASAEPTRSDHRLAPQALGAGSALWLRACTPPALRAGAAELQQAARRALSNRALKPRSARLPRCPLAVSRGPSQAALRNRLQNSCDNSSVAFVIPFETQVRNGMCFVVYTTMPGSWRLPTESKRNGVLRRTLVAGEEGWLWGGERSFLAEGNQAPIPPAAAESHPVLQCA